MLEVLVVLALKELMPSRDLQALQEDEYKYQRRNSWNKSGEGSSSAQSTITCRIV
jgi:hypothetical protein